MIVNINKIIISYPHYTQMADWEGVVDTEEIQSRFDTWINEFISKDFFRLELLHNSYFKGQSYEFYKL